MTDPNTPPRNKPDCDFDTFDRYGGRPCTCGADKPTPPAPTDSLPIPNLYEAARVLEHIILTSHDVMELHRRSSEEWPACCSITLGTLIPEWLLKKARAIIKAGYSETPAPTDEVREAFADFDVQMRRDSREKMVHLRKSDIRKVMRSYRAILAALTQAQGDVERQKRELASAVEWAKERCSCWHNKSTSEGTCACCVDKGNFEPPWPKDSGAFDALLAALTQAQERECRQDLCEHIKNGADSITQCLDYQAQIAELRSELTQAQGEVERLIKAHKEYVHAIGPVLERVWQELRAELAAKDARIKELQFDLECAKDFCDSPCGHSSMWAYTEDGGKHIVCLLCIKAERDAALKATGE